MKNTFGMANAFGTARLLDNGNIMFGDTRVVKPMNEVLCIRDDVVYLRANDRYCITIDARDYFDFSLWASKMCFSHLDVTAGVLRFYSGYENKSVANAIMRAAGRVVKYRDGNHMNLCRSNLYIAGEKEIVQMQD